MKLAVWAVIVVAVLAYDVAKTWQLDDNDWEGNEALSVILLGSLLIMVVCTVVS